MTGTISGPSPFEARRSGEHLRVTDEGFGSV
jgi:hypothetical protein